MATLPTNRTTANTPAEHVSDHNILHGLWNMLTTKGDLLSATAAQAYARLAVGSNGQVLTADSTQSSGLKWATPSATTAFLKDMDRKVRTAGNLSMQNTSWTDLANTMDLSLTAATGDLIEVALIGRYSNENVEAYIDTVTLVSGSPVNHFSAGGASGQGVPGWTGPANVSMAIGAPVLYTLVSGDISGGTVTLRLRFRTNTTANGAKVLLALTDYPLQFWAKNYGAVS